ncbi:MAG: undecaprenyl/decaprenyl-phosphate alpha-N-acetylglucosaminyl 1-phosphate transferase [Magnetococcales bacterium]|nr:undecaprenyl/decaprenyl-phosphate alpha-N-acetylglucosaminyl 1-phosphate transferase [Magnetococcales bacterium]
MPIAPPLPWLGIAVALLTTLLLLLSGLPLARRMGWVDRPDARKCHLAPTPLIGGVAMYGGYCLGGLWLATPSIPLNILWIVATCTLLIGCLDDCRTLHPWGRFVTEFALALLLTGWGGLTIHNLGDFTGLGVVILEASAVFWTMIFFVGIINAVNMSDGLDGVAGGQTLVSFLILFLLAIQAGRWQDAWWILLAMAALLPFLLFNLPFTPHSQARVFMGDAGSKLLGFALVWFSGALSHGEQPACSPAAALWILAVPLLDMFSSVARRLHAGRHPFASDTGHIHHLLLRSGYNKQQVFFILVATSALFASLGAAAFLLALPDALLFYTFLAVLAGYSWFVIRHPL